MCRNRFTASAILNDDGRQEHPEAYRKKTGGRKQQGESSFLLRVCQKMEGVSAMIRKGLAALLALMLLCSTACAEGLSSELYQNLGNLLEETDNVTLKGEAEFTYDDLCFKKLSVEYLRKNSMDHYMNVDFWTRGHRSNGEDMEYTSGYAILARNGTANAFEKLYHTLWHDISYEDRKTLFSLEAVNDYDRLGEILPELAEGFPNYNITVELDGFDTVFHVKADVRQLPEKVQKTGEGAVRHLLNRYLEVGLPEEEDIDPYPYHTLDYDTFELFSALYEKNYGEIPSREYITRMMNMGSGTDEEWDRYGVVYGQCVAMAGKAHQQYTDGYSILRADGTLDHYDVYYQYLQGKGSCSVYYDDYLTAAEAFIEKALQEGKITEEEKTEKSPYQLAEELGMQEYYETLGKNEKAVIAYVGSDGSCRFFADEQSYNIATAESVTQCIANSMQSMALGETEVSIRISGGRISSAEGMVELRMTAMDGTEHSIRMHFSGTVSDYGTTELDEAEKQFEEMISWTP